MKTIETVVGILLLDKVNNQILLQLRDNKIEISDPNMWVLPGGTVEKGENIYRAVEREILEETGYRLNDPKLFRCLSINYSSPMPKSLYFFYEEFDSIKTVVCNEGQKIEFVNLSSIKYLDIPPYLPEVVATFMKEKIDMESELFCKAHSSLEVGRQGLEP